ncbi:MAG: hypothetical protein DSZ06_02470 [Sulfurospirillum sp.]|nr:MAG: hypothetical protein DSZ06_02470 [Sulfurospirillum sp.]
MNCDKYVKKAKVGLLLFISVFAIVLLKDNVSKSLFLKLLSIAYIFGAGYSGVAFVLPYIQCIIDYNQSHKPPHKK